MRLRAETCCGCCDLHTGALIVGICGIIFSIGGIIIHTTALDEVEDDSQRTQLKILVGYSYLYIAINALLIYGTAKESRFFLLPWLIYVGSGLGIVTLVCIIYMLFVPSAVAILFVCVPFWYVWICIWSFFVQLNPTNMPSNLNVYAGVTQISTMAPAVVSYTPQPPAYVEVGKGPEVV